MIRAFVEKACELLEKRVHLLILDLHPPTARDPQGIHGEIWEELTDKEYQPPTDKPFTLVAYETGLTIRAYIEPTSVGEALPDMPLYLEWGGHINLPLEATYQAAWAAFPRRWRTLLERPAS